jgi:hypothetical protein
LSLENQLGTIICFGSINCCSFVNLTADRELWNEVFYSNIGKYGATENNIISAQVIYVDYSIDINDPYVNIYYSDWDSLNASFLNTTY